MIDYEVKGEIPDNRLSFSKIRTVHTCAEKFRLQYVVKARGLVGLPLILGSNWHVGLEHGIKRIIDSVVPKTKEVVEVAVESLKIDLKKTKSLDLDDEFDNSKAIAKDDLKKMSHLAFEKIKETFRPISSESDFTFYLNDGTKVVGRKDCEETVADGLCLTEMKSTKMAPQTLIMFDWQMAIYQASKKTIKSLKKFFAVRRKNRNRDVDIIEYKRTALPEGFIQDVLKGIKQTGQQIKDYSLSGYPKTSDLRTCSWCQYRYGCRPDIFSPSRELVIEDVTKNVLYSSNGEKGEYQNETERDSSHPTAKNPVNRANHKQQGNVGTFKRSPDAGSKSDKLPSHF